MSDNPKAGICGACLLAAIQKPPAFPIPRYGGVDG